MQVYFEHYRKRGTIWYQQDNNKLMKDPTTVMHRAKSLVNQLKIILKGKESVEVDRLMGKFTDALKQV